MIPSTSILDDTARCFSSARQSLITGAAGLYKIKEESLWQERYGSYAEYLEDIQVSQGMASKLVSTYQFYVLDNGLSQAKLENIDHEKLYLALKLPGTAEKKLASAQTLSRQELRQEVKDPNEECLHDNQGTICFDCHKKL
jgi:hypothetical protein